MWNKHGNILICVKSWWLVQGVILSSVLLSTFEIFILKNKNSFKQVSWSRYVVHSPLKPKAQKVRRDWIFAPISPINSKIVTKIQINAREVCFHLEFTGNLWETQFLKTTSCILSRLTISNTDKRYSTLSRMIFHSTVEKDSQTFGSSNHWAEETVTANIWEVFLRCYALC